MQTAEAKDVRCLIRESIERVIDDLETKAEDALTKQGTFATCNFATLGKYSGLKYAANELRKVLQDA